jgi:hypothetical protein
MIFSQNPVSTFADHALALPLLINLAKLPLARFATAAAARRFHEGKFP